LLPLFVTKDATDLESTVGNYLDINCELAYIEGEDGNPSYEAKAGIAGSHGGELNDDSCQTCLDYQTNFDSRKNGRKEQEE
jgi:hypothetical protein